MRGLAILLGVFGLWGIGAPSLKAQPYLPTESSKVLVSLYVQAKPQSFVLKPQSGGYRIFGGGEELYELAADELLYIVVSGNGVRIRTIEKALGTYPRVLVKASSDSSFFSLTPAKPAAKKAQSYYGSVSFKGINGRIESVLETELEQYIAGVVEAEVGGRQMLEMYKVQAVIARTYALSHLEKHKTEKFNLCDDVHCQAFKGIPTSNPDIEKACQDTRNLVVVNQNNELISAVFHANCGGQTANSEDVWPKYKSYLRSNPCPYCSTSRSYKWRFGIAAAKWDKYLSDNGARSLAGYDHSSFEQRNRKAVVEVGGVALPLVKIRKDLGLRSAFFSFTQVGDSIIFSGHGFGHGVGLCQDGASSMARMNMKYQQIVGFYYKGCRIADRRNAILEKEEAAPNQPSGDTIFQPIPEMAKPRSTDDIYYE